MVLKAYKDYQERVLAQKKRCQEMMQQKFPTLFPNISPIQSPVQSPVPSPDRDQIDMKISSFPKNRAILIEIEGLVK